MERIRRVRENEKKRVAVLMSGGVDSSVAAYLLAQEGYAVVGVTLFLLDENELAKNVCEQLGIPFLAIDLRREFHGCVIERFCRAYERGLTPNPCVDCNEKIKFGAAWERLLEAAPFAGEDFALATGHYARIVRTPGAPARLARALDTARDQSYFLYGVARERLNRILFPLGTLTKDEVRALARDAGLACAERPDSMDICFSMEDDYRKLLAQDTPGPIVDLEGRRLGTHPGISHFTLGQRRGLGIPAKTPLYVVAIDPTANTIVLAPRESAYQERVMMENPHLLVPEAFREGTRAFAKIRSTGSLEPCTIESVRPEYIVARFDRPQFAPAPLQRMVFYDASDIVLGGGEICVHPNTR